MLLKLPECSRIFTKPTQNLSMLPLLIFFVCLQVEAQEQSKQLEHSNRHFWNARDQLHGKKATAAPRHLAFDDFCCSSLE